MPNWDCRDDLAREAVAGLEDEPTNHDSAVAQQISDNEPHEHTIVHVPQCSECGEVWAAVEVLP